MNLPKNGRIVIVDDNIDEAQPLIKILSKKRIPFNYYSGTEFGDFPDSNEENKLRVLFLDLNIFELNKDSKTVISSIDGILRAIIPDNPNPYLLVIWSKQDETYKKALEDHFVNNLPNKIPAKIIFLRKGNYFDFIEEKWQAQPDSIERIENDLNEQLQDISLLRNLILWENIVHQKTTETLSEFSSFYPIDANWDKHSKAIIYRLAKAVIGNDDIGNYNDKQKLAKAFININSFLSEKIENAVEDLSLGDIIGVNDNDITIPTSIISSINSKLHLSEKNFTVDNFDQGNVYIIPNQESLIERILWTTKFKVVAKRNAILDSVPSLVQLDITPVCDYSQNKDYVRTIFGVLLDNKFYSDCSGKGLIYYLTPDLKINNQEKFILFDFRFIKTMVKGEVIQRGITPSFKLRREICTDIQSQLANQINRPGISNL
jgi:hypothetical protein